MPHSSLDQAQIEISQQIHGASISPTIEKDPNRAFVVIIPREGTTPLRVFGATPEGTVNGTYRTVKLDREYRELR